MKKERLIAEKKMHEKSLDLIESGQHEDFLARITPLIREQERMLVMADTYADHLQASAEVIFTYECEEAEKEYNLSCAKLKQHMLEDIRLEMERVKEKRKNGLGSTSYNKAVALQANVRKTRSKNKRKSTHYHSGLFPFSDDWSLSAKATKRPATVFMPLSKTLSSSEIARDLRLLQEETLQYTQNEERQQQQVIIFDAVSSSSAFDSDNSKQQQRCIFTRFERGKILYKDWVLQEGDEIEITKRLPATATHGAATNVYAAIICDLTSAEIFVLKESGKYSRILVQDLRNGSISVEPMDEQRHATSE